MIPFKTPAAVAAAILAAGVAAQPAAAAVALAGGVSQHAVAAFSTATPAPGSGQDAWTGAIRDLAASAASSGSGRGGIVNAASAVSARWDSANSGSITFDNHGWSATAVNSGPGDEFFSVETSDAAPDWTYRFTAGADGVFDFGFQLRTVATDAFGFGVWDLLFSPGPGSVEAIRFHGLGSSEGFDDSGTVSRDLVAGQTYTVSLVSRERLTVLNPVGGRNASEFADFAWSIRDGGAGVPEPSSWALAILGFGLAGAALRRRPRGVVA